MSELQKRKPGKQKREPKNTLIIEADDENCDDSDLDSEMRGFAFRADMAGVPDYIAMSQDFIPFG